MTVPALTTADIATFAYWRQTGCAYVQLADVLSILHSYKQSAEYVDGTIKIFDTGSESAAPNNYVLVNVRIRADGWIMAWFPRTLMTGTADSGSGAVVTDTVMEITRNGATSAGSVITNELAGYVFKPTSGPLSGNEYCIKSNTTTTITLHERYGNNVSTNMATLGTASYNILQSRGNLVWWGHIPGQNGDPTSQSTRIGRAIHEMWEQLKTNQQGGSGAALSYSDVGYWDYEYASATHLYIFGRCGLSQNKYYYATIPVGVTVYSGVVNYGVSSQDARGSVEFVMLYSNIISYGYVVVEHTSVFAANYGIQKTMQVQYINVDRIQGQAIVLLTSG